MQKLISLFLLITSTALAGTSTNSSPDQSLSPYFFIKGTRSATEAFPLKNTQVEATIIGIFAEVRITQTYANTGDSTIEATYIFPASTRAAVHGLTMSLGDRRVEAKIKPRAAARQIYEAAKSEGKTASLLEEHRPNVFQMNLANILPGDEVRVELRYTELLIPDDGLYQFVFPTVVGPRYTNKTPTNNSNNTDTGTSTTGAVAPSDYSLPATRYSLLDGAAASTATPYLPAGTPTPATFSLDITLKTPVPIQSLESRSHTINISDTGTSTTARVTIDTTRDPNPSNRDFTLDFRLAGNSICTGLLTTESPDGENYFLAMIQPPARPAPADIPPRDYLFIVDGSGSMHGFPIKTTKSLMKKLLPTLRSIDTFNLLLFSGSSKTLSETPLPATLDNIQNALDLLESNYGSGSTELLPALQHALSLPKNGNTSRIITIITDGYVDVEAEAYALIRQNLSNANLFAFGIGDGVNRHLIESLARAGQGEPFIVENPKAAELAATQFRQYISTPLLTNISLNPSNISLTGTSPATLPDLFAQRPLILLGKFSNNNNGTLTLNAHTGAGAFTTTLNFSDAVPLDDEALLARLHARRRIAELNDDIASTPRSERDPLIAEVTQLGITHNLLTRYTSFVAVDEIIRRPTSDDPTQVRQPLPLPQNVTNNALGDTTIPTSPEPTTLALLSTLALLATIHYLRTRRKKSQSPTT